MLSPAHRLYLLFTPSLAGDKPWRVLENALKGGVDLVQWRSTEPDDAGFRACRDICMARSVPIVVNDDVDDVALDGGSSCALRLTTCTTQS